MQIIFADAAVNIAMTGSLVRIDLGTVTPDPQQQGSDKPAVRLNSNQQLIMPLEGFLRLYGMQEQMVKKLIADGVIKQGQQPEPAKEVGGNKKG
ncbi:MAG: hypothetical protein ACO38U_09885 [Burkholderiaceae bacterium]|jgi:hypothetical protein